MSCDIRIHDCSVLLPDFSISEPCCVEITGTIISSIGNPTDGNAANTINGKGKLLMPGLVDGHTHCCQQLLRGRVSDEYPMVWTRFLVPFESNLLPEDSYISG